MCPSRLQCLPLPPIMSFCPKASDPEEISVKVRALVWIRGPAWNMETFLWFATSSFLFAGDITEPLRHSSLISSEDQKLIQQHGTSWRRACVASSLVSRVQPVESLGLQPLFQTCFAVDCVGLGVGQEAPSGQC